MVNWLIAILTAEAKWNKFILLQWIFSCLGAEYRKCVLGLMHGEGLSWVSVGKCDEDDRIKGPAKSPVFAF